MKNDEVKTLEQIRATLREHKQELHERFHVRQIGVFGSYARRDETPVSDVDILVEFDRPIGWEIVDLHRYPEDLIGVKVDLATKRPWSENRSSGSRLRRTWSMSRRDYRHPVSCCITNRATANVSG